MTELDRFIGRPVASTDTQAANWIDYYPVVDDGDIIAIAPADLSQAEAATSGWVWDDKVDGFVVDVPTSDIVDALVDAGDGAYGQDDDLARVAREWGAGYFRDRDVRSWLEVGVCHVEHARELEDAGHDATYLRGAFAGWATDDTVAEWLAAQDQVAHPILAALIREAVEALDPDHQGEHWPNPIDWDGRPLADQASDLLVLLESAAEEDGEPVPAMAALAARMRAEIAG